MATVGHAAAAAAMEALSERVRLMVGEVTRHREVLAENANLRQRLEAAEQRLAADAQARQQGGAAAMPAGPPQVVDARLLTKLRTFTGCHSEWKTWSFDFEAYAHAVHPRLGGAHSASDSGG